MSTGCAEPFRVAIVGLGPKGTYALDALAGALEGSTSVRAVHVDAFEPSPSPGAGPVYDPAQPPYLRMNFTSRRIDMWRRPAAGGRRGRRRSFIEWVGETGIAADADGYAPRADVGRYLVEGLSQLLDELPPALSVRVVPEAVSRIVRAEPDGWHVDSRSVDGHARKSYDEVLIATGHGCTWEGALGGPWRHAATLVPSAFPVDVSLSVARVPGGSVVAMRGFGLTLIDAVLALTEGRGGGFAPATARGFLRWVDPGLPCTRIFPYSRTGLPSLAKPDAGRFAAMDAMLDRARNELAAASEVTLDRLIGVLAGAAGTMCQVERPGGMREPWSERARDTLDRFVHDRLPHAEHPPYEMLARSVAVAVGDAPVDVECALGHAWRGVYPAIVSTMSHGGLDLAERPAFGRLARGMERLAFGPSRLNAAKLVALVDAGWVDLSHVAGGAIREDDQGTLLAGPEGHARVEVVVDCVLPPPGALAAGPVGTLLRQGHVRLIAGGRGLDVTPGAACLGRDGRPVPGLSAIGRPTEDSVIGNDTLSRELHTGPELWARRIAASAAERVARHPVMGAR